jgi:hypothetical protein
LTGAKVREEIYQAFEMIYPVLQGWFHSSNLSCIRSNKRRRLQEGLVWLLSWLASAVDRSYPPSAVRCINIIPLYKYPFSRLTNNPL